jgi:hypothetical protein
MPASRRSGVMRSFDHAPVVFVDLDAFFGVKR